MKKKLSFNPWLSMWTRPRSTIAAIVKHDPKHLVILLAMASGILNFLDMAASRSLGDSINFPELLALSIVAGAVSGVIMLYAFGWLLSFTGKWIGGKGRTVNIRAALAWSSVPLIWAGLLWIPELLIFGKEIFLSEMPRIYSNQTLVILLLLFSIIEIAIAAWAFVVYLKALGEVQGFSAWKSLLNVLIASSIILGAVIVIALPIILLSAAL